MFASLVEHLDTPIAAVRDVNSTGFVRVDAVNAIELIGACALAAPLTDERLSAIELHDPGVHEPVRDEQRAVGQKGHVLRLAEVSLVVAGLVDFTQCLDEAPAVVAEFVDHVPNLVDDPDVPVWIVRD